LTLHAAAELIKAGFVIDRQPKTGSLPPRASATYKVLEQPDKQIGGSWCQPAYLQSLAGSLHLPDWV